MCATHRSLPPRCCVCSLSFLLSFFLLFLLVFPPPVASCSHPSVALAPASLGDCFRTAGSPCCRWQSARCFPPKTCRPRFCRSRLSSRRRRSRCSTPPGAAHQPHRRARALGGGGGGGGGGISFVVVGVLFFLVVVLFFVVFLFFLVVLVVFFLVTGSACAVISPAHLPSPWSPAVAVPDAVALAASPCAQLCRLAYACVLSTRRGSHSRPFFFFLLFSSFSPLPPAQPRPTERRPRCARRARA